MTTIARENVTRTGKERLPNFLIIGAMKAGTTTLYEDLRLHPDVFLPEEKEPDALINDDIFRKRHLQDYSLLYEPARSSQVCGDASTSYAKLPTHQGVANRARDLLGEDIRVVYMVRDPVARALSHHRYLYQRDFMGHDINAIVRRDNTLVDYSRYAMQIEPWIDTFGRNALHVIIFEDYIQNRQGELERLCEFLSIAKEAVQVDATVVHNRTDDLRPLRGIWRRIRDSRLYLRGIRPLIPGRGRSKMGWVRKCLATDSLSPPLPVTLETLNFISDAVRDDALRFADMTGVDISGWKELHDQ